MVVDRAASIVISRNRSTMIAGAMKSAMCLRLRRIMKRRHALPNDRLLSKQRTSMKIEIKNPLY